tara:strand:- start:779 stop:955 length:177 start_codon:yes stop_codon:yes gene_type:complete
MKRPVAPAVKNRKSFRVEQDFFMKLIWRKSGIFMLKINKDGHATGIFTPNTHLLISGN